MITSEYSSPKEIINSFIEDNRMMRKNLKIFSRIIDKCRKDSVAAEFPAAFEELKTVEAHFSFQEGSLYPLLFKAELDHPIRELCDRHKQIRMHLKSVLSAYERGHTVELCEYAAKLIEEMNEIIDIEDNALFPAARKYLNL